MRFLLATGILAALNLALAAPASAHEVGNVQAVEHSAFGTPPDAAKEPKRSGDPVAFKELLETLAQSGLLVRFSDGSRLTLGAESKVLVDDFVYDPADPASKALISLPAGKLRYITGSMPKGQTTIETPTATMILRGTNVTVDSEGDETTLYVEEGSVSVHSKLTGEDTLVKEGQSVVIGTGGIAASNVQTTGDASVDDGISAPTEASGNDVEHRRGEGSGREGKSGMGGGHGGRSDGGSYRN